MERIRTAYSLDEAALLRVREGFSTAMTKGLERDYTMEKGKEWHREAMAMLPSYVTSLPDGSETGECMAVDFGGTNLRALKVVLKGRGVLESKESASADLIKRVRRRALLPVVQKLMAGSEAELNECIAGLVQECHPTPGTPLGYTFSFPLNQTGLREGRLLHWTKNLAITGMVGEDPVLSLERALERVSSVKRVTALVNDTVGTLVAACPTKPDTKIGVILGTGFNCAYVESTSKIRKAAFPEKQMVVNMESGGFIGPLPGIQTAEDTDVDEHSQNHLEQVNEKMVSGRYLGEIARLCMLSCLEANELFQSLSIAPGAKLFARETLETADISKIWNSQADLATVLQGLGVEGASEKDKSTVLEIIDIVISRSVRLVAMQLVSILEHMGPSDKLVGIAIDGSLYTQSEKYQRLLEREVQDQKRMFHVSTNCEIFTVSGGSGIGAALIAAKAEPTR